MGVAALAAPVVGLLGTDALAMSVTVAGAMLAGSCVLALMVGPPAPCGSRRGGRDGGNGGDVDEGANREIAGTARGTTLRFRGRRHGRWAGSAPSGRRAPGCRRRQSA